MSNALPITAARWNNASALPPRTADAPVFGDRSIRALDIAISFTALLFALPLLVLIAIIVRISDPGPVLFAHRRVGAGGRTFHCLKFRTMVVDADVRLKALLESDPAAREEWNRTQKLRKDPRITWAGSFLRKSSLDELPQLINVLRGEMSLVGPRPIVENEIPRYGRHFALYCSVKPGVTGLWQVQRDDTTSYRRRVAFDVAYARSRSLSLNVQILAMTVPTVLLGRGAC
ncbi:sugar transferase [Novosphingobium cyanobacteriorum]|uniref:Sugar transferase n=1 Tax=Novosphingobium cyanobacteriorum TaxID=3024215 RepID=A0ABT6CMX0_9SPHN|nr:sugar transferase [Novosphingobium cyanobacteriorum]MDF8335257.1 sugar transferase [Novosphingobium cyanobacteriorum]